MDKAFYQAIAARLERQAAQDETFREKFSARMMADKNSITQCCSYIIQQVKNSRRTAFTDDEVYGMAIHFFDEGLTAGVSTHGARIVVPGDDPKKAKAEAVKASKPKPKRQEDESQLSLF